MRELAIIGDVHGQLNVLRLALEDVDWKSEHIVMLGDYVNRGPDSHGVLEYLLEVKASYPGDITLLLGNHEVALLRALKLRSLDDFISIGGLSTIRTYIANPSSASLDEFLDAFPSGQLQLLESASYYFETDDILISHCGYDPQSPFDRSAKAMCEESNPAIFADPHPPRPRVVCGHYVQRSGKPHIGPHLACVDTGCGSLPGSPLTALRWPSMEVRQYWGEPEA